MVSVCSHLPLIVYEYIIIPSVTRVDKTDSALKTKLKCRRMQIFLPGNHCLPNCYLVYCYGMNCNDISANRRILGLTILMNGIILY